jgi:hypothetical protein
VGQADAQRPWLLEVPADTMDTQARPYQDGLLRGQWLKRPGLEEAGLRYISGALEGEAGQPDTLWVWPPLPQEEHQVRWSTTYGLEAGDAYTLYLPARVTIPEASQLPARPPAPGNAQIILNSGSHSVLRHLSLGYTFVTLRGLDVTQGQSELDIGFVDIHHADASCIFTGQGVHGLLIEQLHVRDVHPDNDLEEFGGRWTPEKQRGHGICLYGSQLVVRDNLVSNVNDDMLYFGEVGQALIEGNIAIRSGIFHGNSFENITLFKTLGDITLRGNLALGAQAALLLEERDLNSTVLVEDNILIQEQAGHIYRDRGPEGHGPAVLRNNFMLGGAAAPAWITLNGHDNTLEDNFIVGAALLEPRQAHRNAILAQLGARQPLILDPGEVTSNLLLRQDDQGGPVLAWRNASALPSRVSSNTMVGGVGLELAGQGVALRPQVTVDHNLIQGDLLRGASQDSDPGPVELEIAHNHYSGDRLGASSWQAGVIAPSNQHVTLAWVDPGALRLGLEDPAHWALDGQPVGYQVAGLAQPGRLPLPLPALWVQSEQREDPISGEPDPPPPTDADPMDADPSQPDAEVELGPAAYRPGGCVCATSGASSPSAWLWLLLPLTSWRRLR